MNKAQMVRGMCRGMPANKVQRWLGYIQGVLVAVYGVPLYEMKKLNDRAVGKRAK